MTEIDWHARARGETLSVQNYIGGKRVDVSGNVELLKHAPHSGELLYTFGQGDAADVDRAVSSANAAFADGRWRDRSISERQAVLMRLGDLVEEHRERFALLECLDVGKPVAHALHDDVARAMHSLRSAVEDIDGLTSMASPKSDDATYQLRKPLGVVGAIVGWNYPLSLAASKVAPALITGNSLVLKPSEFTSLSATLLAELAIEAGVPEGVFNVVHGSGAIVGDRLARHPDVRLISFTGSTATGKRLMKASADSNMKRVILECGGKSPYLIFDDYEGGLEELAGDVLATGYANQGALCVSSTRIIIQDGIAKKLLPLMVQQAAAIKPDDPLSETTSFGALINKDHFDKVRGYIKSGLDDGATLLCGGGTVREESGGNFLTPAIFDDVSPDAKIAREEIFGPVLSVFKFGSEEQALQLANDTEYGLAAYVATGSAERGARLAHVIDAAQVLSIQSLSGNPGAPPNGVEPHKQSGFGFEGGVEGLAAYTAATLILKFQET